MRTSISILSVVSAFMFSTVSAAPAFTGQSLRVTNLNFLSVEGGNDTLRFTLYDPEPLANTTATCSGSWSHASDGYPKATYARCQNTTLGWHVNSFDSYDSFSLGFESSFRDPSVGAPPYDRVTTFSNADIGAPAIECSSEHDEASCSQPEGTIIYAPVTSAIAKK